VQAVVGVQAAVRGQAAAVVEAGGDVLLKQHRITPINLLS
jgi:hypothetical protein